MLIVGGGVAGLEAALALRDLAGERVEIEIRDTHGEFVYRPFSVGAPYDAAQIVQRSAFPDAYAKWESLAASLVEQVGDVANPTGCTPGGTGALPPGAESPRWSADCAPASCAARSSRCRAVAAGGCRSTSWPSWRPPGRRRPLAEIRN